MIGSMTQLQPYVVYIVELNYAPIRTQLKGQMSCYEKKKGWHVMLIVINYYVLLK